LPDSNNAVLNVVLPSVPWRCWLGGRKSIWPVKTVFFSQVFYGLVD